MAEPPLVLITRPAEDADRTAARLAEKGYRTQCEPLLAIRWLEGGPPDLAGVQGLLFTSANGVRAFARRTAERGRRAWAVGDATARTAREAGFVDVVSAGGDAEALAALVRDAADPNAGALLHVAGTTVAGDLGGRLAEAGFAVRRLALYEAETASALSEGTAAALREERLRAILFFSPRTARTFVRLMHQAVLARWCGTVEALCLSRACADAAGSGDGEPSLAWLDIRVAAQPTEDALVALLPDRRGPVT